jgi:uncharacterized membrane protein
MIVCVSESDSGMPLATTNYAPQTGPAAAARQRQAVQVWAVLAVFLAGVAALILLAPLALAGGQTTLAAVIYRGFSAICHQIPARSFHLDGHPFAVCARCTGLYCGLAAGALVYPRLRSLNRLDTPARGWLILALVPASADFLINFTGLWENTPWSRALTGGILGAAIALYLVPGLLDLRFNWRSFFGRRQPAAPPPLLTNETATAVSDYSAPARRIRILAAEARTK